GVSLHALLIGDHAHAELLFEKLLPHFARAALRFRRTRGVCQDGIDDVRGSNETLLLNRYSLDDSRIGAARRQLGERAIGCRRIEDYSFYQIAGRARPQTQESEYVRGRAGLGGKVKER